MGVGDKAEAIFYCCRIFHSREKKNSRILKVLNSVYSQSSQSRSSFPIRHIPIQSILRSNPPRAKMGHLTPLQHWHRNLHHRQLQNGRTSGSDQGAIHAEMGYSGYASIQMSQSPLTATRLRLHLERQANPALKTCCRKKADPDSLRQGHPRPACLAHRDGRQARRRRRRRPRRQPGPRARLPDRRRRAARLLARLRQLPRPRRRCRRRHRLRRDHALAPLPARAVRARGRQARPVREGVHRQRGAGRGAGAHRQAEGLVPDGGGVDPLLPHVPHAERPGRAGRHREGGARVRGPGLPAQL